MRMPCLPLLVALPLCALHAQEIFPNRETFGAHPRPVEEVPLEAFTFGSLFGDAFEIKVWAQSPLIFSPVAMDVDAAGRLWVTEGIDYSVSPRVAAGQSIMVVTDTDHDGTADTSHVFVTEKDARHAPLGIAVFDNRIVLSATPSITVYTDVNRNAVFEPDIDTKEIFLTGFQNKRHDHTLHAVVGSPSGEWYFSYGNCGADIRTQDGRHFLSGCYYGYPEAIGQPSSDGHVYVGGVAMRVRPDGTGLTPVGHNLRNSHDMVVSSLGDVYQSDNDDPAHARATWLMRHGNMGYADLKDGSRSWEEVAKTWEEPQGWHRDLRYSTSHWRESYPGACPPDTVYGAGSPTGNVLIEDDLLGPSMRGVYLVCDMVRKEVMAWRPQLTGAHVAMGPLTRFLHLKEDAQGEHFLPTDLVLGPDGALFLSDFYNDTSRRTNQVSGTIYRITRRDHPTPPRQTPLDFESVDGLLECLRGSAMNARSHAVNRLVAKGEPVVPKLIALREEASNPFLKARPLWVLARLGEKGRAFVQRQLLSNDPQTRLTAFRALRDAAPEERLSLAQALCQDTHPSIRREVALSLRDVPFETCQELLSPLLAGYDGEDRWYLEALGIAATKKESLVYQKLIRPSLMAVPVEDWGVRAQNLAWRLHTPKALEDLDVIMRAQSPDITRFRHLAMAYASYRTDAERATRAQLLQSLASLPAFSGGDYQITIQEILAKDLNRLKGEGLTSNHPVPKAFAPERALADIATIAALPGDAPRGQVKAGVCLSCHKINGQGVPFGPDLTHWGKTRTVPEILKEIVDPSAGLAHGYDKPIRLTSRQGEFVAEGLLSNFSWHAGSLKIKLFGGETKKILFRRTGVKIEHLDGHSWMPPASLLGLSDQDLRDIAAYLRQDS